MAIRSEPFSGCNTKQGAPSNAPSKLWNAALALAAFSLVAAAPSPSQSGQPSDLSAPELEAAKKLGLPIAQTGAPLCKTPEVLIGAKKLTAGIAALNKAIDEIQNNAFLFQSTRPDDTGQPKGAGTTLTPEERQQIDVLEGLRAKLRKKIEELEGAPSCESLLAAHALPASGGATLGLHLIETPQGGAPLRGAPRSLIRSSLLETASRLRPSSPSMTWNGASMALFARRSTMRGRRASRLARGSRPARGFTQSRAPASRAKRSRPVL